MPTFIPQKFAYQIEIVSQRTSLFNVPEEDKNCSKLQMVIKREKYAKVDSHVKTRKIIIQKSIKIQMEYFMKIGQGFEQFLLN